MILTFIPELLYTSQLS